MDNVAVKTCRQQEVVLHRAEKPGGENVTTTGTDDAQSVSLTCLQLIFVSSTRAPVLLEMDEAWLLLLGFRLWAQHGSISHVRSTQSTRFQTRRDTVPIKKRDRVHSDSQVDVQR